MAFRIPSVESVEFVCLRHEISTKNIVNKKSLTVFEATELDCSKVF